jgi:hypothetical protein
MYINDNTQFLINIIQQYNILNVDFLACETLLDNNWNNFYKLLMENTKVIVGASNNKTGNLLFGGDWVMESTNTDIELIYFNKSIEYYKYLLGSESYHTVFIRNGKLYACGDNRSGQLGDGTTTNSSTLVQMTNNTGTTPLSVSCGYKQTWVLFNDGRIYCCGHNLYGQLGNGTFTSSSTLVLMTNNTGTTPLSISCGTYHTVVLMSDKTMYACGANSYGQLGNGTTTNSSTLVPMTNNTTKTPVSINCGAYHTMVSFNDGTIHGCGHNEYGQLGNGTFTSSSTLVPMTNNTGTTPVSISCGAYHTVVLMTDKAIYGCGANWDGQLGNGTTTNSSTLVPMINNTTKTPVSISCGADHTMISMFDKTIHACGYNYFGQLGNGTFTKSSTLVQMTIPTDTTPLSVSCGANHTVVLMIDKTRYACGFNYFGQLGNGTTTDSSTLVLMNLILLEDPSIPSITNFPDITKTFGSSPFPIVNPDSTSDGLFTYTSSNPGVATVSGSQITIVSVGIATITVTQSETDNYLSGIKTLVLTVTNSTSINPTNINEGNELLYVMQTSAEYVNILGSIEISNGLISSTTAKILYTTNIEPVKITLKLK